MGLFDTEMPELPGHWRRPLPARLRARGASAKMWFFTVGLGLSTAAVTALWFFIPDPEWLWVVIAHAAALVGFVYFSRRNQRSFLVLTDLGIEFHHPSRVREVYWHDVARIQFAVKSDKRDLLAAAGGPGVGAAMGLIELRPDPGVWARFVVRRKDDGHKLRVGWVFGADALCCVLAEAQSRGILVEGRGAKYSR